MLIVRVIVELRGGVAGGRLLRVGGLAGLRSCIVSRALGGVVARMYSTLFVSDV